MPALKTGSAQNGAQQLPATFAEISGVLLAEPDVQRTLDKMCVLLVDTVEGCDHSVVTLVRNHHLDSPAASDDVGPSVDAIQFGVHEGPCVEAIKEHHTVVTDDLVSRPPKSRWRSAHLCRARLRSLRAVRTKEDLARLREVVETRELIGQAKGILMGRRDLLRGGNGASVSGTVRLRIELRELASQVVQGEEGKRQRA